MTTHLIAYQAGDRFTTRCGAAFNRRKPGDNCVTVWHAKVDCVPCADPATPWPAEVKPDKK